MKKTMTLVCFVVLLPALVIQAQNLITVQNGTGVSFYQSLDSAIANAQNGDTLYLSSGVFPIAANTYITKKIHVFGAGHHPDSSGNITSIFGGMFFLNSGSNGSTFEGFSIHGFNSTASDIDSIRIHRCRILISIYIPQLSNNWLITENVIGHSLEGTSSSNQNIICNNIIVFKVANMGAYNTYRNNLFLWSNYYVLVFSDLGQSVIENNVFLDPYSNVQFINSLVNNNLFVSNFSLPSNCIGVNNIANHSPDSIFVNQSGNSFDYNHDYHLAPYCQGISAGTDNMDIGIYGGLFPWKEGSIPSIPRIESKTISNTTDQNGNLQVNIKVKAQDN